MCIVLQGMVSGGDRSSPSGRRDSRGSRVQGALRARRMRNFCHIHIFSPWLMTLVPREDEVARADLGS